MELLKEETENFKQTMVDKKINPHMYDVVLDYAFFLEENYQGEKSHQEAAIKMIETLNIQRAFPKPITVKKYIGKHGVVWIKKKKKKKNITQPRSPLEIKYTDALYFYDPYFSSPDSFGIPREEPYAINIELMHAKQISPKKFFAAETHKHFTSTDYYAGAFLSPPYSYRGTKKDFIYVNNYLFPKKEKLIIYQWDNDWSNYFVWGKDWWGATMWTVYDPEWKRFTVIGASSTD